MADKEEKSSGSSASNPAEEARYQIARYPFDFLDLVSSPQDDFEVSSPQDDFEVPLSQASSASTSSAPKSSAPQHSRTFDCEHCGKDEDSAFQVVPIMNSSEYRLELQSAGLFRCSMTGIKFQVTCAVTIVYEVEAWQKYEALILNLQSQYEIIGPLFNVKTDLEPGVVSAVYLPHCLCLKDFKDDKAIIKCVHLKDNITLEVPTKIEPYYVILDNPTFSPIGVLLYPFTWIKDGIQKRLPCHGMALIYWKISGYSSPNEWMLRIHLYLMPCNLSFEMEIHNQKKDQGYIKLHKPPQTALLYNMREYDIRTSQEASVLPKKLLFRCSYVSELYPYTEITLEGKNINKVIAISVEHDDISVWQADLDRGDIMDLKSSTPKVFKKGLHFPKKHFVDKHRPSLVDAIKLVKPILDELQWLDLLTGEQSATIGSKPTSQEQMRELYCYITHWSNQDKDTVYKILRKHNGPIINRLEGIEK